jgi:hypothetical protein
MARDLRQTHLTARRRRARRNGADAPTNHRDPPRKGTPSNERARRRAQRGDRGLKKAVHDLNENVTEFKKGAVDRETVENIVTDLLEKQAEAATTAPRALASRRPTPGSRSRRSARKGVARLEALHTMRAARRAARSREPRGDRALPEGRRPLLLISAIKDVKPRETKFYNDTYKPMIEAAVNTTGAGAGAEWIPKELSPNLIDRVELELKVLALFTESIPMPTNPFDLPGRAGLAHEARAGRREHGRHRPDAREEDPDRVAQGHADREEVLGRGARLEGGGRGRDHRAAAADRGRAPRYMATTSRTPAINGDTAAAQDTAGASTPPTTRSRTGTGSASWRSPARRPTAANAALTSRSCAATGRRWASTASTRTSSRTSSRSTRTSTCSATRRRADAREVRAERDDPDRRARQGRQRPGDRLRGRPHRPERDRRVRQRHDEPHRGDHGLPARLRDRRAARPDGRDPPRALQRVRQDAVKVSVRRAFVALQPAATEKTSRSPTTPGASRSTVRPPARRSPRPAAAGRRRTTTSPIRPPRSARSCSSATATS